MLTTAFTTTMSREEAQDFLNAEGDSIYRFIQATSYAGRYLALALRGGRSADPAEAPRALLYAEELERRLEALAVLKDLPPAEEPKEPRPVPPEGDLKAMLGDAGSDARYVKRLLQGGAGMSVRQVPEALRVVRGLRPKLAAIGAIYETMPKPELVKLTSAEQEAFWRKMDALAYEDEAVSP